MLISLLTARPFVIVTPVKTAPTEKPASTPAGAPAEGARGTASPALVASTDPRFGGVNLN